MQVPTGPNVKGFDVGTGASFIYPLLGAGSYGWSFLGSDVDLSSVLAAQKNLDNNMAAAAGSISSSSSSTSVRLAAGLRGSEVRLQDNPRHVFRGVLFDQDEVNL
jgi:23S rRNA (adenine1618-N6)-methyltransferase